MAAILALDHLRSINELSRARCDNVAVLDTHLKGLLIPVRSSSPRTNRSHFDIVYLLSASMPTTFRPLILRELQSAGVAAAAPSTRPLNRILRSIPPAPTNIKNTILQRLTALAASAPSDDRLPYSTNLHDRMIALPAARLYHPDTTVSDTVGAAAAHAVKNVLRENP
jgi:dTDP-4-amino-4,6-dideoxygalactose transaminase